jgi:hypothetical protein
MMAKASRKDFDGVPTDKLIEAVAMAEGSGYTFEGYVRLPRIFLSDPKVSFAPVEAIGVHALLMDMAWTETPACSVSEEIMELVLDRASDRAMAERWVLKSWQLIGGRWWQRGLLKSFLSAAVSNAFKAWGRGDRDKLREFFHLVGVSAPGGDSSANRYESSNSDDDSSETLDESCIKDDDTRQNMNGNMNMNEEGCIQDTKACAEPAEPAPTPEAPPVLSFPIIKGKKSSKSEWHLTEELLDELMECYEGTPFGDRDRILEAIRQSKAWILANMAKRKTASGMPRFITGWLQREQNSGKNGSSGNGKAIGKPCSDCGRVSESPEGWQPFGMCLACSTKMEYRPHGCPHIDGRSRWDSIQEKHIVNDEWVALYGEPPEGDTMEVKRQFLRGELPPNPKPEQVTH